MPMLRTAPNSSFRSGYLNGNVAKKLYGPRHEALTIYVFH